MKKVLLSILMVIFVTGMLKAGSLSGISRETDDSRGIKIKITLTIEFGRISKDCRGFGICSFHISLTDKPDPGMLAVNEAIGEAYFDDDGHFVIEFARQYLKSETRNMYFDSMFRIEENFDIPVDVLDSLDYEGDYNIKKGQYPIDDRGDVYLIRF